MPSRAGVPAGSSPSPVWSRTKASSIIPMLLGGDEMGRTQQDNNNAYCQGNEILPQTGMPEERKPGDTVTARPRPVVVLRDRK